MGFQHMQWQLNVFTEFPSQNINVSIFTFSALVTKFPKWTDQHRIKYSRVSFCDGPFYDDSRPLSSRTEHDLWCITVATHASFLYLARFQLFSGVHVFLIFLFSCSSFKLIVISQAMTSIKKTKKKKIKTADATFFLDVFWTTAWTFFNKIKSELIDFF
jgi:hypothetical protein